MGGLSLSSSERLVVDKTLRCSYVEDKSEKMASVWALGDCCEVLPEIQPLPPKTAQVAIQQADVVAFNILNSVCDLDRKAKEFEFQDLGSMLALGGPNGAIIGPGTDTRLGSVLVPLLDTARVSLSVADNLYAQVINSPGFDNNGRVAPVIESL